MANVSDIKDKSANVEQNVVRESGAVKGNGRDEADLKFAPRRQPTPIREDRLPPHSVEAEQGALGCILIDPNESMGLCIQRIKNNAEAFYDPRHQILYKILVEMYDKKEPIDLITVTNRLKDRQLLDSCGGIAYLTSLIDATPSAANLDYYISIVREKYLLRKMLHTCVDVVSNIYDFNGDVDELLDKVETRILQVSEERVEESANMIKDLVRKAIEQIENYHQNQGMLSGLSTGFPDLDKLTLGLQPGDMIVIAARPSVGKTSLAMNIAEHVAIDLKQPVGVFSLEMTAESLVLRMLCSRAKVNLKAIREGFIADRDFPKILNAANKLASSFLFIDDTSNMSILELRAKARRMAQQYGIKLFVIDYLQLLHSTSWRAKESRQQEIAEISRGIKALAKELNVPVIVLSQLNRDVEKDKNRTPRLSDLRESGAIEQDADVVGLLYRPDEKSAEKEKNGEDVQPDQKNPIVKLNIAKQRNGPTGEISLIFLKEFTRFESLSRVAPEDIPANA